MQEIVGVKFKKLGKVYFFNPNGLVLEKGQNVIVETARGIEYGEIATPNCCTIERCFEGCNRRRYKNILRK